MTYTTILIDDEPAASSILSYLLTTHCKQLKIAQQFTDPDKALVYVNQHPPDLLFLDIEMPGMNGFDFLQHLTNYKGSVIFVTAHSHYALRAFKFSAIDYLLKPVDAQELKQAVNRFLKLQPPPPTATQLQTAAQNLTHLAQPGLHSLAISHTEGITTIDLNNIEYLKAERSYTQVVLSCKKEVTASRPLKVFEELLADKNFVRIHKSYLVNLHKVKEAKMNAGLVILQSGIKLNLGRVFHSEFSKRYRAYKQEKQNGW